MSAQGSGISDYVQAKTRSKYMQQANVPQPGVTEAGLRRGTTDLLEEARQVVENAVGQGQELSPMIYQMLGIQPQYEDNTGQLNDANTSYKQQEDQFNAAQQQISNLRGIPAGKRTPQQRQQLRQLVKGLPKMEQAVTRAKTTLGQLQTMPKKITGLSRMDPSQIPSDSPFSANNPLNQAVQKYESTLNAALNGQMPVDPTLAHQYDQQEQALRARLAAQYGPDYENSSVGQMALQAFGKTKADAFATYNRQIVDQYSQLAFGGAQNLQTLLSGNINLLEQPSQIAAAGGNALTNTAQGATQQESVLQQQRLAQAGLQGSATNIPNPAGLGLGIANAGAGAYGAYKLADALRGNTPGSTPNYSQYESSYGSDANAYAGASPSATAGDTTGGGSEGTANQG